MTTDSNGISQEESAKAQQTEGEIVQTGGSSPVSFDEFESLEAAEKVKTKIEAKKEVEKDKAKKEVSSEEKPKAKKEAKAKDDKKTEQKEGKEEAGAKKEAEPSEEPQEGQEAAAKPQKVRVYKIMQGDDKVAVRGDSKFPVKSDGQEEHVSLQDLINSFSGHKAVDKRLGEFGAEKQRFIAERRKIDNTLNELSKAVQGDQPELAIMRFFEVLGGDPIEGLKSLKKSIIGKIDFEKFGQLEPEQKEQYVDMLASGDYKAFYDHQKERREVEASEQRLNGEIDELLQKHGIEEDQFNAVGEELFSLKEQGKLKEKITPQMIANACIFDQETAKAQGFLKEFSTDLAKDFEVVEKVRSLVRAGMSQEDILSFLKTKYQVTEEPAQDDLSRRVVANERVSGSATTVKQPQNEDMWSFDQL